VPRQISTGDRTILGKISKRGIVGYLKAYCNRNPTKTIAYAMSSTLAAMAPK